ncbi:MAG: aspartyl/asparaginyl beta-hydroxylase domain-containing protein [Halioglobus sp.]
MTRQALQERVNNAVKALQSGQHELARQGFQALLLSEDPLLDAARKNVQLWMGLAYACGNCKDQDGALDAVNRALLIEPRSPQALLFKADHLWHCAEMDSAAIFYQSLLQVIQSMESVPPDLAAQSARAEQRCKEVAERQLDFLERELVAKKLDGNQISPRFGQALSISLGKKQFYPQQPSKFFFPELPHIQFFEPSQFKWTKALQAKTATIKQELQQSIIHGIEFEPYLQETQALPRVNSGKIWGNESWGALYLWKDGKLNESIEEMFSQTIALLRQLPLATIPGGSPNVLFSRLKAGTSIPAHHGFFNTRLICHLPLIVPENCGQLRVGNESRDWVEGELIIFDDSIEHEAWNHSAQDRIVLIFEIWRPELSTKEIEAVRELLQTIRDYRQD